MKNFLQTKIWVTNHFYSIMKKIIFLIETNFTHNLVTSQLLAEY